MRKKSVEKGDAEEISEINVVPLADISLVLLIVLMIITPMVMQSMIKVFASRSAVAAGADQKKELQKEKPLFLEIREDGYFLNTNKMSTDEELFMGLRGELSRKMDRSVIVTVGKNVLHGTVVRALDVAKQAGADKLSLVKRVAAKT
jgi:biopolymer transport protein ExbD